MPNVRGLDDAPTLHSRLTVNRRAVYGQHATVTNEAQAVILRNLSERVLATVDFSGASPRVNVDLSVIDGDTVTPVNALVKPYGKVKAYWREPGTWRFLPTGTAISVAAPVKAPVAPKPAPIAPPPAPISAPVAPIAAPTVAARVSAPAIIATEKRFTGKQPVIRPLTKTYSEVGDVTLPHEQIDALTLAWSKRQRGVPGAVLITGPAGTAKTRLAEQFAFTKGVPFLIVNAQGKQTADDWYGGFVPNHEPGATSPFHWVWSDFALALQRGEPMVILVDEINRAADSATLNGLFGILDWTATYNPNGAPHEVRLPAGIMVVATLNEGVEYVGTVEVDRALRDRFTDGVRMEYTPETIDSRIVRKFVPGIDKTVHGPDVSKRLVRVAATQRAKRDDDTLFPSHSTISTRNLISIAESIVDHPEIGPARCIWSAIRSGFIPEDFPGLSVLIEAQFGANPEPPEALPEDDDIEAMLAAE